MAIMSEGISACILSKLCSMSSTPALRFMGKHGQQQDTRRATSLNGFMAILGPMVKTLVMAPVTPSSSFR